MYLRLNQMILMFSVCMRVCVCVCARARVYIDLTSDIKHLE